MSNNSRKRAYSVSSASADGTPEEEPEKLINDKDIIKRLNPLDHVTAMNLLITAARSHLLVLPAVKAETSLIYEQGRSSTFDFDRFFVAEETSPIFPLITAETWSDGNDGSWSGRRSRMQLLRLIGD